MDYGDKIFFKVCGLLFPFLSDRAYEWLSLKTLDTDGFVLREEYGRTKEAEIER
jgi:hypothetical protein